MGVMRVKEPGLLKKQLYERVKKILDTGKQRYLDDGGEPRSYRAGFKGKDYLTDEERQEVLELMRQIFGVTVKDGYAHTQDKSWKLPEDLPLLKEHLEADS
jgi:hypothetical protein